MSDNIDKNNSENLSKLDEHSTQRVQLGIRLQPINHSEQPVFANFSVAQAAPGMMFIDFGFLEPGVVPSALRAAQSGGKVPETVNGQLAARVVLGLDAAAQLAQQLNQQLRAIRERAQQAASAEGVSETRQ